MRVVLSTAWHIKKHEKHFYLIWLSLLHSLQLLLQLPLQLLLLLLLCSVLPRALETCVAHAAERLICNISFVASSTGGRGSGGSHKYM